MTTKAPFTEEGRRTFAQLGQGGRRIPGLISRLLAFLLDIVAMMLVCMLATYLIRWNAAFFRLGKLAVGQRLVDWQGLVDFLSRAVVVVVTVLYFPLSWTLTGQSVGKAILGLRVVRQDPRHPDNTRLSLARSFVRATGYWLSALPLGLGFLLAALDDEHRTLHDRLAGTRVVYQQPTGKNRRLVPRGAADGAQFERNENAVTQEAAHASLRPAEGHRPSNELPNVT